MEPSQTSTLASRTTWHLAALDLMSEEELVGHVIELRKELAIWRDRFALVRICCATTTRVLKRLQSKMARDDSKLGMVLCLIQSEWPGLDKLPLKRGADDVQYLISLSIIS